MVGAVGYLTSEIFLFGLNGKLGLQKGLALLIANEAGLIATFILHETWTYKHVDHKHKTIIQKITRFHLSAWSGIAIIFGIGLFCIHVLGLNVYISQAIGSGVAMFWNFFWTKYFIFKGKTPEILQHPEDIVEGE
jgi:putative flippase GtrA